MTENIAAQSSFDWPPFYNELAKKLVPYRNRQPELLQFLKGLDTAGTPITSKSAAPRLHLQYIVERSTPLPCRAAVVQ